MPQQLESTGAEEDHVFPGTDGAVYVASRSSRSGRLSIRRLGLSVEELVRATPLATGDGSVLLGSRLSTAYVLDAAT
ncbi:hypothetical protein H632_c4002p0, partial [Helicosporidium sp. ATCC 50920]